MKALNVIRLGIWICLSPIVVPAMLCTILLILLIDTLTAFFNFLFGMDETPFGTTKSMFEDIIDGMRKLLK